MAIQYLLANSITGLISKNSHSCLESCKWPIILILSWCFSIAFNNHFVDVLGSDSYQSRCSDKIVKSDSTFCIVKHTSPSSFIISHSTQKITLTLSILIFALIYYKLFLLFKKILKNLTEIHDKFQKNLLYTIKKLQGKIKKWLENEKILKKISEEMIKVTEKNRKNRKNVCKY